MAGGVLEYFTPEAYADGDRSYLWLYLAMFVILAAVLTKLSRFSFRSTVPASRLQEMKEARARMQRDLAEAASKREQKPESTEQKPPEPIIDPSLERRAAYFHDGGGDSTRGKFPNVRDRYKFMNRKGG